MCAVIIIHVHKYYTCAYDKHAHECVCVTNHNTPAAEAGDSLEEGSLAAGEGTPAAGVGTPAVEDERELRI